MARFLQSGEGIMAGPSLQTLFRTEGRRAAAPRFCPLPSAGVGLRGRGMGGRNPTLFRPPARAPTPKIV